MLSSGETLCEHKEGAGPRPVAGAHSDGLGAVGLRTGGRASAVRFPGPEEGAGLWHSAWVPALEGNPFLTEWEYVLPTACGEEESGLGK